MNLSPEISNPQKKIFTNYTKKDLVDYYTEVAEVMLPHIKGRPLSLFRFPNGTDIEGFFQKDMPYYFPNWIEYVKIKQKRRTVKYIVCNNKESLVFIASQVGEFHIWTSTIQRLGYPDKMVFDLDPSENNLDGLRKVVKKLAKLLEDIGFMPYLMTTGKKGYHVVTPIFPEQDNDAVRAFALKIAVVLKNDDPDLMTIELLINKRKKRVFIDVNRNSPHQTSIAPYSVRAVKKASVALPIEFDELGNTRPDDFDIGRTLKRIKKSKDPWIDFNKEAQSIKEIIRRLKK